MFEYVAGGASTSNQLMYWREEGLLSENAVVKKRGNLYIVVEGPLAECEMAVKSVRDEFYGDTTEPRGGSSAALRQSVEAANTLLSKRSGIGASCVCATVSEWGQLTLLHSGDCHAFLFSGQDGEIYKLGQRQTAEKALGRVAESQFGEVKRILKDRDILILCSGALVDSLSEEEIASVTGIHGADGPEGIARRLVEKASLQGTGGISTALVVLCEGSGIGVNPTLPLDLDMMRQREFSEGYDGSAREAKRRHAFGSRRLSSGIPGLGRLGQVPAIAGGAAVLITALLLSRPLVGGSTGAAVPTPSALTQTYSGPSPVVPDSTPALPLTEGADAILAAVDAAYKKSEWGGVAGRQELVSFLEQLQRRSPGDAKVVERLNMARTNLIYAQQMQAVAEFWGKGETSASSTGSWAGAVEALETLKAYSLPHPLSDEQKNTAKDKLYSAHINYGKALDMAKRSSEAKGQRDRAEEIKAKGW